MVAGLGRSNLQSLDDGWEYKTFTDGEYCLSVRGPLIDLYLHKMELKMSLTPKIEEKAIAYSQPIDATEIAALLEGYRHPTNTERGTLHRDTAKPTWLSRMIDEVRTRYPEFRCGTGNLNFMIYSDRIIWIPAKQGHAIEIGLTPEFIEKRERSRQALLRHLLKEEEKLISFSGILLEEYRSYNSGKNGQGVMETWHTWRFTLYLFKEGKKSLVKELSGVDKDTNQGDKIRKEFADYKGDKIQTYYKYTGVNTPPMEYTLPEGKHWILSKNTVRQIISNLIAG